MSTPWRWNKNRTMQSLCEGEKRLGVYIPMPNNKSYSLEIRNTIDATAELILAAPALKAENERLREALRQISEGRGRFSLDNFEHARNTIEDMKELALAALAPATPTTEPKS